MLARRGGWEVLRSLYRGLAVEALPVVMASTVKFWLSDGQLVPMVQRWNVAEGEKKNDVGKMEVKMKEKLNGDIE